MPINYALHLIENHDKFLVLISVSNPPTAIPGTLTTETGVDAFGSKGDDDELSSSNSVQILDKSKSMTPKRCGLDCNRLLFMILDSKYLSNLNDINKSEQKSNVEKGFGWPTEGEAGIGKFVCFFVLILYSFLRNNSFTENNEKLQVLPSSKKFI